MKALLTCHLRHVAGYDRVFGAREYDLKRAGRKETRLKNIEICCSNRYLEKSRLTLQGICFKIGKGSAPPLPPIVKVACETIRNTA